MMNSELLFKLQQSMLIDPTLKDQIIARRSTLSSQQQLELEQYITMSNGVQGDLYQKAIDQNPKLEQGIKQIIQKYQTSTLSLMGGDTQEADKLLSNLPH